MNSGLSLDLFFGAASDVERTQYRFLNELKIVRNAFGNNVIYPYLGHLINLHNNLQTILTNLAEVRDSMPGELSSIDLDALTLAYNKGHLRDENISNVEEVISWALPLIQDAIEEGRTIFEFVEDNMLLEEVGIIPSYVEEGYVLIPDRGSRLLHILQYRLSIFTGRDDNYRSLKTTHLDSVDAGQIDPDPTSVKLSLLSSYKDLPNPATYTFVTDLDFPYEGTLLPVAKRKLMRYLYGGTGSA